MPSVLLHGGLGNQLFQYAVGRTLSIRTGSRLRLEISHLDKDYDTPSPPRRLHLHEFPIQGEFIRSPLDTNTALKIRLKLFSFLRPFSLAFATRVCRVHRDQSPQRFTPEVLRMPGNGLLYGYYQSEKYFDSIRDRLRDELTPRSDLAGTNRTWKDRIDGTNSVAVHVRRGDYTARGWALPPKYYRAAIRQLDCRHSTAELFFFSDDMAWVRRNVDSLLPNCRSSSAVHFVDCNSGEEVVNDLVLMQSCRHNVIANSTLSWWGAWLNRHDEKTVLTPMCWIHNSVGDTDIIPERWTPVRW